MSLVKADTRAAWRSSLRRAMADLRFPDGRSPKIFVLMAAIDALGTGLLIPIGVIYFTLYVKLPAVQVGLGLSAAGLVGTAATPVAGVLVDRYNAKIVGAACHFASAMAVALYLAVHSYAAFLLVVCVAQATDRMFRPAKTAMAAGLVDSGQRVRLLALHRTLRNVGYGLGGLLATIALLHRTYTSYATLILGDSLSYLMSATLITMITLPYLVRRPPSSGEGGNAPVGYRQVLMDRRYVALAALNMIALLHATVLEIGIPLWIVKRTHASPAMAGVVFTTNTVLVVILQVRASRVGDTVAGAGRAYRYYGVALLLTCLLGALTSNVSAAIAAVLLVLAGITLTIGEVFATAAEWGVSLGLAPELGRGRYLALFSTGSAAQIAFGPAIVTLILLRGGEAGWLLLGLVFLATGAVAWRVTIHAGLPEVQTIGETS